MRKLLGGAGRITSLALHPSGDHIITGAPLPPPHCSYPGYPPRLWPDNMDGSPLLGAHTKHCQRLWVDADVRPHKSPRFLICLQCWCGGNAGAEDKRLSWYDMDLSTKPYRALRYHKAAVRGAAFHRTYPLFASSSDDGSAHVFHGMVYQARPPAPRPLFSLPLPLVLIWRALGAAACWLHVHNSVRWVCVLSWRLAGFNGTFLR